MNISLTKSLEQFVRQQVSSGFYHSASEVVRTALRTLRDQKNTDYKSQIITALEEVEKENCQIVDESFWSSFEQEILSEIDSKKN